MAELDDRDRGCDGDATDAFERVGSRGDKADRVAVLWECAKLAATQSTCRARSSLCHPMTGVLSTCTVPLHLRSGVANSFVCQNGVLGDMFEGKRHARLVRCLPCVGPDSMVIRVWTGETHSRLAGSLEVWPIDWI